MCSSDLRRRRAAPLPRPRCVDGEAPLGVPGYGREGQVSAEGWENKAEGLEGEKRPQQHGCRVFVYLGHDELAEGRGQQQPRCCGSALLAVHERVVREWERQWGGVWRKWGLGVALDKLDGGPWWSGRRRGPGATCSRHRGGGGVATVLGRQGARMVAWRRAALAREWDGLGELGRCAARTGHDVSPIGAGSCGLRCCKRGGSEVRERGGARS